MYKILYFYENKAIHTVLKILTPSQSNKALCIL